MGSSSAGDLGQVFSGSLGIDLGLGPVGGGLKPGPGLDVPTFLILQFLISLYFRKKKIFCITHQEWENWSLAPPCPVDGPAFCGGSLSPHIVSNSWSPTAPTLLSWLMRSLHISI